MFTGMRPFIVLSTLCVTCIAATTHAKLVPRCGNYGNLYLTTCGFGILSNSIVLELYNQTESGQVTFVNSTGV